MVFVTLWDFTNKALVVCIWVEGNGTPLQYSCLENPMDRGAWWAGVTKSQTWLNDFTLTFHFHVLEKEMATHSSILAWIIPGTGEPGVLPSMGSHRVWHYWSDLAAAAAVDDKIWVIFSYVLCFWGGMVWFLFLRWAVIIFTMRTMNLLSVCKKLLEIKSLIKKNLQISLKKCLV